VKTTNTQQFNITTNLPLTFGFIFLNTTCDAYIF